MSSIQAPWADQNLLLVALAAVLCVSGAVTTSRFFRRMTETVGAGRRAWLALTSLASGVTIWCTHFVAMLGYHPGVPVSFDWALTGASLVTAAAGSALAFALSGDPRRSQARVLAGGVVLGLTISAMHYIGMAAMQMGAMSWNRPLVALSVLFAVAGSILALRVARGNRPRADDRMAAWFVLAVVLLHFTGMSAMGVMRRMDHTPPVDSSADTTLAIAIVVLSLVTIGVGVVGYLIESQSRLTAMEDLRRQAMTDGLTGLANRAHLNARLQQEIVRCVRRGTKLGIGVVDIDEFKQINDLRGHLIGDEVLRVVSSRMKEFTEKDEDVFVARMGGDEFMVLCRCASQAAVAATLDRLRHDVVRAIQLGGDVLLPEVSIGAAVYPDDALDAEALVNNADLAMYRAKGDAHNRTCFYDAEVDERTRLRRGLAADLRHAVERGELFLHYQVQASVASSATLGFEALLRWRHPQLGLVSPAEFIPLAESGGTIVPIGEWVLRTACADAVRWDPSCRLSVNLSAVQLADPGLTSMIAHVLQETGLPVERLELEVTETAVFADRDQALSALEAIKALGVSIALDDFGVGYSSLDALRVFPFDRIKLDRSFFMGDSRTQTVALVETVLSLGRIFGMSVIAEGIEFPEQLDLLRETGCDEVQGFLFGRPASIEDLVRSGELTQRDSLAVAVSA